MPCWRPGSFGRSNRDERSAAAGTALLRDRSGLGGGLVVDGEGGALRIDAHGDPVAAGNLHRSVDDLAAVLLDFFGGAVDVLDADVVQPGRRTGSLLALGVDAAIHEPVAAVHLVDAVRPHIHGPFRGTLPAEEVGVEAPGGFLVGGGELVPGEIAEPRRRFRPGLAAG